MASKTGFKWYDGFFLSLLAFSVLLVIMNWERFQPCKAPLHLWVVVDYGATFVFRVLMFANNWIAASVGLDDNQQLRGNLLIGRLVVLSILYLVLYPFLWGWSVLGAYWFCYGQNNCLSGRDEKWAFFVWLLLSFSGLICIGGIFGTRWFTRRQAYVRRAPPGARISYYRVLLNMIRQPEMVYVPAVNETTSADQNAASNNPTSGLQHLRAAFNHMIQHLPVFTLRAIPTDCNDCAICLEEFCVGQEVRGLPCAHNFHVACIDKWLRLNLKCPRCRCFVFPNFSLDGHSFTIALHPDLSNASTTNPTRNEPTSSSYFSRMQSFLMPPHAANAPPSDPSPTSSPNPNPAPTPTPNPGPDPSTTATSTASNTEVTALEIVGNEGGPSEPAGN